MTLHVEMLRLAVMFRRSGHRQISQALETGMAGEIRAKMAVMRLAKEKMIAALSAEIDDITKDVVATHADGLDAMKLPRAELDGTRQEIREIIAEFAPLTNGGPSGPLPGAATSPKLSVTSGASASTSATDPAQPLAQPRGEPAAENAAPALPEPAASWKGQ